MFARFARGDAVRVGVKRDAHALRQAWKDATVEEKQDEQQHYAADHGDGLQTAFHLRHILAQAQARKDEQSVPNRLDDQTHQRQPIPGTCAMPEAINSGIVSSPIDSLVSR